MKKLNLKTIIYFLGSFFITLIFLHPFPVSAAEIADPADIFFVEAPAASGTVKGNIDIRWRMYDDEQESIPISVRLYDSVSCENTFYGNVTNQTYGNSSQQVSNSISWNTTQTTTLNPLSDGNYCLRVCASMLDGTTPYSVCNYRYVKIINNNSLPTITSVPNKTVLIEGESFNYKVAATDSDYDQLTYRFVQAPSILNIDRNTGVISSGALSTYGNYAVSYEVIIEVNDSMAGSVRQSFTLVVQKPAVIETPPNENTTPPTPTEQQPPDTTDNDNDSNGGEIVDENNDKDPVFQTIEIIEPTSSSIFKGALNTIEWKLTGELEFEKTVVSFSKDLEIWVPIAELDSSIRDINWNVAEIEDGDTVYIKIELIDSEGNPIVESISDDFEIKNKVENNIESVPLIINVQPENNSEISNDVITLISGLFIPSEGAEILPETFEIRLNDNADIRNNCSVNTDEFRCETSDKLETGRHLVIVSVEDSSGQKAEFEWGFTVFSTAEEETTLNNEGIDLLGNNLSKNGVYIIVLICLVAILLLIIPWLLYIMFLGSKRNDELNENNSTYNYYADGGYTTPPLPTIQPVETTVNYVYQPEDQAFLDQQQGQSNMQPQNNTAQNNNDPSIDFYEPPATS
ncbi:MAG: hypothetical protein Q9M91_08890 [Candidatus Dojkabacteria bacterium]|nr:hypothetical protein [Candidatus Dojkabacteria bacterium]MDQ7021888.1 hypothetical protein [Candidatus Dojkabacteria bacterium]